jgi:hypothetical protein
VIAPGQRLLPMFILVAASLGTAALIESCVEAFGIDGDPIYLGRVGLLGVLALACAGIVATFVAQSCTHCELGRYRAHLQRDVLDRLPFSGHGFRFTAIVAVLQALCMASIQIGDTPNPNENVIGWATSFLLVLTGTVVVRFFLRLMPRLAHAIVVLFVRVCRPRQAARVVFVVRSRSIGGFDDMPQVMFKRPPPHPVHA